MLSATRSSARLDLLRSIGPPLAALARRTPTDTGTSRPPRILLIRPDHIGDVLLTSAAVSLLRRVDPTAHLTYLVGSWSAAAARYGPRVDVIDTLEFPGFTRRPKDTPIAPYTLLAREARRLRARHYDAAIVFRPDHWWGALLALAAGIPVRVGADTPETRALLTHTLAAESAGGRAHAAERALMLARLALDALALAEPQAGADTRVFSAPADAQPRSQTLGPTAEGDAERQSAAAAPVFTVPDEARQVAARLWREHGLDPFQVIAIQPNAGAPLKTWPLRRWAELINAVTRGHPHRRAVLVGAPDDRTALDAIAATCAADLRPPIFVGQSLAVSAAIYARARIVVGPDSGAAHLAAAVGTATVRLYGPARPDVFGPWPPRFDQVVELTEALRCAPCDALEAPPCGALREPACMLAIDVDRVRGTIERLLSQG